MLKLLSRAQEAHDVRKEKESHHPMTSHEAAVKAYSDYLMTQMVHVSPESWPKFTSAVQDALNTFTTPNPPPVAPLRV